MAKHADKWAKWAQQGDRVAEQMRRENDGKRSGFGPDATVHAPVPPVTCPRCRATIQPEAVARHGMLHRGIDSLTS